VGLLYDSESQSEAYDLAKPFMNANLLEEGRISVARSALRGKIGNKLIQDIALEMLTIASSGLARRNQLDSRGMDERQFLDPLFNIVKNNQTGAEKLLQKYNNSWDCNINKIFTEDAF
jgi:glutamate--cysteine ligase